VPVARKFDSIIEDLKDRIQFRELTAALKAAGVASAMGWDKLAAKLDEVDSATAIKVEGLLKSLQNGLILGGTKAAFIFELTAADANSAADDIAPLVVPPGSFTQLYPKALSATALKALGSDHELTAKIIHSNGDVSVVLCSKRSQEDRTIYGMNEVTAAVQTAFAGYDEFVAIKRTDYQIFDVLTVRKSLRRIEVLIDHPDRIKLPESSDSRCLNVLGRLSTYSSVINTIYQQNRPIDLKACVNALYQAKTEGKVSKLSFRTPTRSVNRGAMTSSEDLRKEPFHEAGVNEVGQITPFDITIFWDALPAGHPPVSVRIGMPISGLSEEDSEIREARIISAHSDAAVLAVLNKLVSYSSG